MEEARWAEKETKENPGKRAIQCELIARNDRYTLSPGTLCVSALTFLLIEKLNPSMLFYNKNTVLHTTQKKTWHFFIHDVRSTLAGILLHLSTPSMWPGLMRT
jgi:hypothetical protein